VSPWGPVARTASSPSGDLPGEPTKAAAPPLDPEASPYFRELRDRLDRGEYAEADRRAFSVAFEGTVRAYGLTVPRSCSDRRFLTEYLRPDMGPLVELVRELYRLYEPVRFGTVKSGDRDAFLQLLRRLYSETVLGRIHDPSFQPSALPAEPRRPVARYDMLFREMAERGGKGG